MHKAFFDNLPEALNTGIHFNIGKTCGRNRYKFEIPRFSKEIGVYRLDIEDHYCGVVSY